MAKIRVHLINPKLMGEFYVRKDIEAFAINAFVEGTYESLTAGEIEFTGEEAAEEMFDISNNPYRGSERYEMFGRCRSVSVGDMVEVDGDLYLCAPTGWRMIDTTKV